MEKRAHTWDQIGHIPPPTLHRTYATYARVLTSEECMLEAQAKEDKYKQLERIEIKKRSAEEKLKK